nr:MAG TPA: hypothetical protein [Caudoviricetes sp.]
MRFVVFPRSGAAFCTVGRLLASGARIWPTPWAGAGGATALVFLIKQC